MSATHVPQIGSAPRLDEEQIEALEPNARSTGA